MRLVRFSNGKYGVRSYWFFGWRFKDLRSEGFWWGKGSRFFEDCMSTEEHARRALQQQNQPYYEVVE